MGQSELAITQNSLRRIESGDSGAGNSLSAREGLKSGRQSVRSLRTVPERQGRSQDTWKFL